MSETKPQEWAEKIAAEHYPHPHGPGSLSRYSLAKLLSERFHDPEKVAKLMEVVDGMLQGQDSFSDGLASWASVWDELRAALAGLKEGKK